MKLIQKLREKLAKVAMAGVIVASTFAPSACNLTPTPNPDPSDDPTIENPIDDPIDDPADNPTETHSQLYYDVLNSAYYNNLIDKNKTDSGSLYANDDCAPIPFGFLEKRGFNINAIKNGTLACTSAAYIKDGEKGNLYISVKVENAGDTPYYTCYMLKYPITNSEYSDLCYFAKNGFVQASFFIQELSYEKDPTIESESAITITAYNNILKRFVDSPSVSSDLYGTTPISLDFVGFDEYNFECYIRPDYSANIYNKDSLIRYAKMKSSINSDIKVQTINNGTVYSSPDYYVSFVNSDILNNYKTNPTSVTYFSIQLKRLYDINMNSNITLKN